MSGALDWTERRVRHLALEAPRASIPRVSFLVEDALRTATLPGAERGLIVVRALDLGIIHPSEPPGAVARRIEKRWREVMLHAVDAGAPEAPYAETVRFASEPEMLALYIQKRLQGTPPAEWFWKKAVPPRVVRAQVAELFAVALVHLLDVPEHHKGQVAAVELLARLGELGVLSAVVAMLDDVLVRAVLARWMPRVLGYCDEMQRTRAPVGEVSEHDDVEEGVRSPAPIEVPPLPKVMAQVIEILLADSPTGSVQNPERRIIAALEKSLSTRAQAPSPRARSAEALVRRESPAQVSETGTIEREPPPSPEVPDVAESVSTDSTAKNVVDEITKTATPDAAPSEQLSQQGPLAPTRHGGLLFALAILNQIGWLELDAEQQEELLPCVLLNIAQSAGALPDDPLLATLAGRFDEAAAFWHREARRWTRRRARMLLNWVVRRAALIGVTRTHIDVYFSLDQVDVRIRRLGLDLNPGWVPALGKVVIFHYDAGSN